MYFRILMIAKDIPSNQKTETLQPPKEKREHQVPVLFWTFAWHFGSGSALPVYQGWVVWEAAQEGVGGKKCLKLAAGPRVKRRRVGASTLHQQHHHPPRFQRTPFHFCGNYTVFLKSWLLAHVVDWISRQVAPCLVWSPTKPALPSTLPLLLEMRSSWHSSKHCCVMGLNDWCGKSGGGFALRRCFCKGFCFPRWHDW